MTLMCECWYCNDYKERNVIISAWRTKILCIHLNCFHLIVILMLLIYVCYYYYYWLYICNIYICKFCIFRIKFKKKNQMTDLLCLRDFLKNNINHVNGKFWSINQQAILVFKSIENNYFSIELLVYSYIHKKQMNMLKHNCKHKNTVSINIVTPKTEIIIYINL